MEWIGQLAITLLGSILSYLAATKKSKNDIEKAKIEANTEIEKIREESTKEIERIKTETEEQIKLKIAESNLASKENDEKLKNEAMSAFFGEFLKDPKKGAGKLKDMQEIAKMFKQN